MSTLRLSDLYLRVPHVYFEVRTPIRMFTKGLLSHLTLDLAAGGMGDVSKRPMSIDVSRRNQGLELFPNRNGRQRLVDNGGDHAGQQAAA